ncbi:MAG: glycoside hydrolase family 127 protein [Haliscomenobacter sp.]|nr:glycoside hydrolase family 127 protein [Haliscomenobacter sp.]
MDRPSNASHVAETLTRLPFASIRPEGWLKAQMQRDMAGFAGNLDRLVPGLIDDPIYTEGRLHRKSAARDLGNLKSGDAEGDEQYQWWNSETQSNWWDAYIRNAILLQDPAALDKAQQYVRRMLSSQDDDGYLGIYDKDLRYRFSSENGELWAKTTLFRGLLAYYEYTQSGEVWNALVRAVDDVMANYPMDQSSPFFSKGGFNGGISHGLTFTDVLDRMAQLSGDPRYLAYAAFLYRDYCQTDQSEQDAQLKNILSPDYKLQSHGVHTYEHLRPLAVAYYATGDPQLKQALDVYLGRIQAAVTCAGGPIGDEWIGGRMPDATQVGYEYCSIHELMDSYALLLQKTGNPTFADAMEDLFYNAAQGARHPEHSAIAYLKTDNSYEMMGTKNGEAEPNRVQTRYKYSPVHQDVAVCCAPNAGRISPYFVQAAWMKKDDRTLAALLLAPSTLETEVDGAPVRIVTETRYPYSQQLVFRLELSSPLAFCLKVRKPAWCTEVKSSEAYREEQGFLVFDRRFAPGDEIRLTLESDVRVLTGAAGDHYFAYGPLVYARPIEAAEEIGRTYAPGFEDRMYRSLDPVRYGYVPGQKAQFSRGRILARLKNQATQKIEQVALVPIGKTVLRQAGF